MRVRRVLLLVAVASLAFVPHASAQTAPAANTVQIVGFKFLPPLTIVDAGTPVTWTNTELAAIAHNVTPLARLTDQGPQQSNWGCADMLPGGACTKTVDPGLYVYTCTVLELHTALMQGILLVR